MYKCLDCGHIFEEGEQARWSESRGEYWGAPCSEEMSGCPLCKGDYEETVCCSVCNGNFLEEELNGGICESCVDEIKSQYRYNPQKCYELSKGETEKIKINCFLACMFTEKQIEEILLLNIRKASALMPIDCSAFMDADKSWFEDKIVEEVKNSEKAKRKS